MRTSILATMHEEDKKMCHRKMRTIIFTDRLGHIILRKIKPAVKLILIPTLTNFPSLNCLEEVSICSGEQYIVWLNDPRLYSGQTELETCCKLLDVELRIAESIQKCALKTRLHAIFPSCLANETLAEQLREQGSQILVLPFHKHELLPNPVSVGPKKARNNRATTLAIITNFISKINGPGHTRLRARLFPDLAIHLAPDRQNRDLKRIISGLKGTVIDCKDTNQLPGSAALQTR
jgi:hypothetical protein